MNVLVSLATLGPSGAERSVQSLLLRVAAEMTELRQAIAGGSLLEIAEELGDVAYYAALLEHNGSPADAETVRTEALMLTGKRLGGRKATLALAESIAAAKYRVRFAVNGCRKDRDAEYEAILQTLAEQGILTD